MVTGGEIRPTPGRAVQFGATLAPGKVLAVTGPSGAGKTTLLRAISGLTAWHRGSVTLDGAPPETLGWPTFRRRVPFVSQRATMFTGSVHENLARPFSYRTAKSSLDVAAANRLLLRLGFEDGVLKRSAREMSAGEQQRVALVRGLLLNPDVLLLDEPTAALDEAAVLRVETLLLETAEKRGLSVLLVTHDLSQIERLSAAHVRIESKEVT